MGKESLHKGTSMTANLTDNWIDILPTMINYARRKNFGRIQEFEPFIQQHPLSAAEYAGIFGPWPEAESVIATSAAASFLYAKKAIKGRFEEGECAIATDAQSSFCYAKDIIRSPFPLGETAIATHADLCTAYARDVLKSRFILGEKTLALAETEKNLKNTLAYYQQVINTKPDHWKDWTEEQLKVSPCWLYLYAKEHIKGRLPDVLHNTMLVFGMTLKDNYYVKKYFKAKKYQKKVKYHRKKRSCNLADEVNSVLSNN